MRLPPGTPLPPFPFAHVPSSCPRTNTHNHTHVLSTRPLPRTTRNSTYRPHPRHQTHPPTHLQGSHAEHKLAHGAQAVEGQLQPDVEQQEDDPQLRQVADRLHILDDAQRGGAHQRTASLAWVCVG
jgi:hypothetical protein